MKYLVLILMILSLVSIAAMINLCVAVGLTFPWVVWWFDFTISNARVISYGFGLTVINLFLIKYLIDEKYI